MNESRHRLLKWVIAIPFAGLPANRVGAKETKRLYWRHLFLRKNLRAK